MKKRGFIITETIFSLILAASVAAVAVLAVDLKTDQFHLDRFNPFDQGRSDTAAENNDKSDAHKENSSASADKKTSDAASKESTADASKDSTAKENSENKKKPEQSSKAESSDSEAQTLKFRKQPENLSEQPKELADAMAAYDFDIDTQLDGNKLIMIDTVNSGSLSKAIVYCFEKSESGYWWNIADDGKPVTNEAYIGENGSGFDPAIDSKITPGGIFSAGAGFYIKEKPDTSYEMFQITENTYWVTDPDSTFYNQKVESTENKDWSKADHMITSEKSYKYGLTTSFNTYSPDSALASAIFLHCGNAPTEGSIAMPEEVMKAILEWLDKNSNVTLFITI